jgi:hypothetical protein
MATEEFERYAAGKREEGRRVAEGEAHPIEKPEPKTGDALDAVNASLRTGERDVPPDAEGFIQTR